jgi:hypothetical protein
MGREVFLVGVLSRGWLLIPPESRPAQRAARRKGSSLAFPSGKATPMSPKFLSFSYRS